MELKLDTNKEYGLVLEGGGAKGAYQIGAWKALKEAGVKTTYRCFANSRHGFAVNLYDEWKEGETYIVELMKKHFAVEK